MNDAAAKLGDIVGGIFGDVFSHPVVRLLAAGIAAYVVILWIATAWWAYQDTRRRHADPTAPYLSAALVILSTPLLFPLGLLVYAVARPGRTLAERRLLALEEQLDELERQTASSCPRCSTSVEPGWLACPSCRTRLAYRCVSCDKAIGVDWTLCAWCGAEFGARAKVPVGGRAGLPVVRRREAPRPVAAPAFALRRSLAGRRSGAEGRVPAET